MTVLPTSAAQAGSHAPRGAQSPPAHTIDRDAGVVDYLEFFLFHLVSLYAAAALIVGGAWTTLGLLTVISFYVGGDALLGGNRSAWRIGALRLERRGLPVLGWRNRVIRGHLASLALLALAWVIGGLAGAGFFVACEVPYQNLKPLPDAPMMPFGYLTTIIVALIPPLWHRLMTPRLLAWDREHATAVERQLAAAANQRSGVPALRRHGADSARV